MNADSCYVDGLGHVERRDFLENGSCEIGASKVGMLKLTPSQITVLEKKENTSKGGGRREDKIEMWAVTAVRVYKKRSNFFSVWSTLAQCHAIHFKKQPAALTSKNISQNKCCYTYQFLSEPGTEIEGGGEVDTFSTKRLC